LDLSVSATTRKPREGEVDGVAYYFLSEEEFTRRVEAGEFLEWDGHFDKRYGTLRSEVDSRLEAGHSVILEIDVNGALNVKRMNPDAVLVFIAPPSLEVLEERLRGRGTETEEQIALRLARVEMEMAAAEQYDEVVVNDDLETAVNQLDALMDRYETDERNL
jgi:guanylate kinase